jgi:uncharacterized membrane protein
MGGSKGKPRKGRQRGHGAARRKELAKAAAGRRVRYPELDLARGLALVLMIVYHGFFVTDFIGLAKVEIYSGFFWWFARFIAASFLFIAGVSLTLARGRVSPGLRGSGLFAAFFKRGGRIFAAGLLVSAVTLVALGSEAFANLRAAGILATLEDMVAAGSFRFVAFGILHLIGLCIALGYPLARKPVLSLALGCCVLAGGIYLGTMHFDFPWLVWLGFRLPPAAYAPVDYVPVLPWASWFLFGMAGGNLIYPKGKPSWSFPELGKKGPARPLAFIGRHSLAVYLVHLPVVYGVLYLVKTMLGG